MLMELIYFLNTLLDQEHEGCYRTERVQNPEVSYVRYLIGRNQKKFDYINCVVKCFRLRSTRVRRHTLPLVAMHLLDRSCVSVGFFRNCMLRFPTVVSEPGLCVDDMRE